MTTEELRKKAVMGTKFYLNYLNQHYPETSAMHLRGQPRICSIHVTELEIFEKVIFTNNLRVIVDGEQMPQIKLKYNREKNCMIAYGDSSVFAGKSTESILLVPDMRFIAEHLLSFFQSSKLFPPPKCTQTDSPDVMPGLSCDQYLAVHDALTEPFVYIEGLPGSGKTTHILAFCIVWLITHGHKVILTAPTNHSLDVALKVILQQFQEKGYSVQNVVRLGHPTPEFYKEFPEACICEIKDNYAEIPEKCQAKTLARMNAAMLLAGTIDTIIWFAYKSGLHHFHPEHIFLDEAAYTPLIKALALLALQTNMTFLGDGQQLAPVCTIEPSVLRRPESVGACLWALPAYEMDAVLSCKDLSTVAEQYFCNSVCPNYQLFLKDNLYESFRYSGKLAKVLSENVYKGQLIGRAKHNTEIVVLNAVRTEFNKSRTNAAEVRAILTYLAMYSHEDYAVLTPYCNQMWKLKKALPQSERVMTIHRAQSHEWNTVILSVVDTADKLYTDSNNKWAHGLQVLNTAISRARKKLVLVCDVAYWKSQKTQLICKLIETAENDEGGIDNVSSNVYPAKYVG